MKKKISTIIQALYCLFALSLITACEKENVNSTFAQNEGKTTLTLVLNTGGMTSRSLSRAEEPGDNRYHENHIDWVDIFFYPEGSKGNALHSERKDVNSTDAAGKEIKVNLSSNLEGSLFPDGNGDKCTVYVIANYDGEIDHENKKNTSIEQLKQLVIDEDFSKDYTLPNANFVMDGESSEVILNKPENGIPTVRGNIDLYRAASKIALFTTIKKKIKVKDANNQEVEWYSDPQNMTISFHNGVNKAHVDVRSKENFTPGEDTYFSIEERKMTMNEDSDEENHYYSHAPFYSYSSNWYESVDNEAYLTLELPWYTNGKEVYRTCYYQIPVNRLTKDLVRNNYYKINLTVAMLGSFVKEEWVELNPQPSYLILDWSTNEVSANLKDFRYLMVEKNYIVLNNLDDVSIPLATSHPAEIVFINDEEQGLSQGFTKPDLTTIPPNDVLTVDLDNIEQLLINNDQTEIIYENQLNNNFYEDDFDFVPYTLTFRIRHKDKYDFYQDVTIVQYPAVYGIAEVNSDYYNTPGDPESGKSGYNDDNGYVWVNGYQEDGSGVNNQMYFASANGMSNSDIANPTMYVITVTSVKGTPYTIGDPREINLNQDILTDTYTGGSIWATAPVLLDNSTQYGTVDNVNRRTLMYYYATDVTDKLKETGTTNLYDSDEAAEVAERTLNMLAPKFRVASAYAVLGVESWAAKSLEGMKKRCASYQEDGYPAGRWRMPTKAEFEFIFSLSDRGLLGENIYQPDIKYWCAHGTGLPKEEGTVEMNYVSKSSYYQMGQELGHSIRCVYDEWYWTDKLPESEKNTFTWGDRAR